MNPMLLQLLQRFGPRAAGMLQNGFGTRAGMIQPPEPELTAMPGQPQGPPAVAPPISGPQTFSPPAPPLSPNERVAQGFNMFGPNADVPVMASQNLPTFMDVPPPVLAQGPTASPQAPMPAPRPPEAPAAPPEMNFFQRNAAMMQDPNNPGSFIDPMSAQRAQASGPDVINKFLQMFKDKA